jgi:hypothetical protein
MRCILILALSIASCAVANATPVHHPRARAHVSVNPAPGVAAPGATARIAVPGWSEEDTRRWLDNAGSLWRGI